MSQSKEQQHSPEPWQQGKRIVNSIVDATDFHVCLTSRPIDAERIVRCVNFCAGIHSETLELINQSGFPTLQAFLAESQRLREENKRLTDQLRALREAEASRGLPIRENQ
jgi:hypothetical protein